MHSQSLWTSIFTLITGETCDLDRVYKTLWSIHCFLMFCCWKVHSYHLKSPEVKVWKLCKHIIAKINLLLEVYMLSPLHLIFVNDSAWYHLQWTLMDVPFLFLNISCNVLCDFQGGDRTCDQFRSILPCQVASLARYPERSPFLGFLPGEVIFEDPVETFTSILITKTSVQNTTQNVAFIGSQEGHLLKVRKKVREFLKTYHYQPWFGITQNNYIPQQ